MKLLIIALVLQASSPAPTEPAEQARAQEAATPAPDQMTCVYDRQSRQRLCTTPDGEQLRCRRERVMGSRMPVTLCTTAREDEVLERDSRRALDQQQHVTTPAVN
jgi:hypothetical protein